jgi:DNA-binding PadR family transcriptional regulator
MKTTHTLFTVRGAVLIELLRGPGHSEAIIGRIRACSRGKLRLSQTFVGAALRDLQEQGLASATPVPTLRRGRRPLQYTLTTRGRTFAIAQRDVARAMLTGDIVCDSVPA